MGEQPAEFVEMLRFVKARMAALQAEEDAKEEAKRDHERKMQERRNASAKMSG